MVRLFLVLNPCSSLVSSDKLVDSVLFIYFVGVTRMSALTAASIIWRQWIGTRRSSLTGIILGSVKAVQALGIIT